MLSSCLDSPGVSSAIETRIVLACSMAYEVYPQYILEVGRQGKLACKFIPALVPFLTTTTLNACVGYKVLVAVMYLRPRISEHWAVDSRSGCQSVSLINHGRPQTPYT